MVFLLLSGLGGLSACSIRGCPEDRGASALNLNDLETAALYNRSPRPLPPDSWTENPGLELFLREIMASDGISSIAKYGMQCTPRSTESGCKDCFTCTKSFQHYRLGVATLYYTCQDFGEIFMRAEVGPGPKVSAISYWKTTPLARKEMNR